MTSKKKSGSKLASGVRQVKLQREQAHVVPAKTVVAVKAPTKPAPTVTPTRPAAPVPARAEMNRKAEMLGKSELSRLHPLRVWPD